MNEQLPSTDVETLHNQIRGLIEAAKGRVLVQVNQALVLTYWQIGRVIKLQVVREDRAEYGDATIKRLADRLVQEYGSGFGARNLLRMVRFFQQFQDFEIVTTVSAQWSWSHFVELVQNLHILVRRGHTISCCIFCNN